MSDMNSLLKCLAPGPTRSVLVRAVALPALVVALVGGCAAGPAAEGVSASSTVAASTAAEGGVSLPEGSGPTQDVPAGPVMPASCSSIAMVEGARIAAADFAQCLEDFARAARTGTRTIKVTADSEPGHYQWLHADDGTYGMVTGGDSLIVITPTDAWMRVGGKVVKADPNGDSEAMWVADMTDQSRRMFQPDFYNNILGLSSEWVVEGREEVEVAGGTARSLWRIVSATPIELVKGFATEVTYYTEVPGPTAKIVTTDGTAVSEVIYEDWGEPIDTDAIEEIIGKAITG
ncbi:hypothetical protein IGS67_11945 [Flavimobilis sp. GY10621]|uniref:Lipoprotein n=1 Tax=Flavimobilis rhizosphaerae TaxID=2775421 RepID=A0ABR9DSS1_9MICO|nr:hypothetical protein [Flavimobilis rhizosphaerae]MBD9700190.1 hypothetical protein [Flavimobilis rhizosphaerae]